MSFEEHEEFAREVADLNRYGQALNQCTSVDEVVSLTLEAITLLFDFSNVTVLEVREGDLRIVGSTDPGLAEGDEPRAIAREACESGETVTAAGPDAGTDPGSSVTATMAVPEGIVDEVTTVIVVRSESLSAFGPEHVQPMEILASHAATAMSNIRSRERLERARQDLATRKEMIEMYDRLLRHDIGNDLQVIAGYAEALTASVEDGEAADYAERIERAAHNSADLVDRVGDLVTTLEQQNEPEARELRPIVAETVGKVTRQYDSLSVEFDPADFEYRIYAGDLLDSVFSNVLSNAAVHNEGEVTVDLYAEEPSPDRVVVGMADDGSGVPAAVRDDLFEMGERGPESDGSGFGLGFVRALTESYGGGVELGESPRGGADFRVTLERA